jgi:aspartate/methionine/tyrosine aminotransferase
MSRISHRIGAIAPSATLTITSKAKALRAAGEPVIGFGAGEPDFPTPAHVVEAAVAATRDPRMHRYSPAAGLPELREAVAASTADLRGVPFDAAQVVVTNGGKQAVYSTFATLFDPGDEVLLPSPYWVTYPEAIRLAGGTTVEVPTTDATGFKVTPEMLESAATPATKALIFVSPSNPTGAVYTPDEVEAVARWALERGIWVVSDEIYDHLTYGDSTFTSPATVVPELAERLVIVNGVAKTYAMTGWRVGWIIGPPDVATAAANLQSHLASNVANVSQAAAVAALTGPQDAVAAMRVAFDRRRRAMLAGLRDIAGVDVVEPHGAFYAFPNLTGVLGRPIGGEPAATTLELADRLLDVAKVAIVPGEAFGAPGYARLSYALADDDLAEGLGRIADVLA